MTRYCAAATLSVVLAFAVAAGSHAQPASLGWQGGEGGLTFSAEGSEISPIKLRCEGRAIVVSVPPPTDPDVDDFIFTGLQLKSGTHTGHYRAMVIDSDLETRFEIRVAPRDPVLRAFSRTGQISVRDEFKSSVATKAEKRLIRQFFADCH